MPDRETDSEAAAAVLRGQRRYFEGEHKFHVKDQTRLVAEGLALMIYPESGRNPLWYGESTGPRGKPLYPGDRVIVNNAIVEFRTEKSPLRKMPDRETKSEAAAAVLRGQRRYLEGSHEFHVKDQTRLVAEGREINIYSESGKSSFWFGEGTGPRGEPLHSGDRVEVYNAIVEFRTGKELD